MDDNSNISIINGRNRILVSAPHSFLHPRKTIEGVQMRIGETYTDEVMKDICARSETFGISLNSQPIYDPNFDHLNNNPYKHSVKNLVRDFKINYFIDLHGLSNAHQFDIGIYFKKKFENSKKLAYKMAKDLNHEELRDSLISLRYFKNNGQETLSEYACSKLKIPAVQIEIAWYILEDERLRNAFVRQLSESVSSLF